MSEMLMYRKDVVAFYWCHTVTVVPVLVPVLFLLPVCMVQKFRNVSSTWFVYNTFIVAVLTKRYLKAASAYIKHLDIAFPEVPKFSLKL